MDCYKDTPPFVDDATSSTVMCNTISDDSPRNTYFVTLKACEVNDDDFKLCFHGPKVIPKNNTPATICIINTIGTICSRRLFHISS